MPRSFRSLGLFLLILVTASVLSPAGGSAAAPPTLDVIGKTVTEGTFLTVDMVFKVVLSEPASTAVTVSYTTVEISATAGDDFTPTSGTLRIKAGKLSKRVIVPIEGDGLDEPTERLFLTIYSPHGATIQDEEGLGKIIDDDDAPFVSMGDSDGPETSSGWTTRTFNVYLTSQSGRHVTVDWATLDGSATENIDYVAGGGTVSFPAGVTTKKVKVTVNGDVAFEDDESFAVHLSNPVNVNMVGEPSGTGWLRNDDACPTSPADPSSSGASATAMSDVADTNIGQGVSGHWICPETDVDWFKITAYEADFVSCSFPEVQRYRTEFNLFYNYVDKANDLQMTIRVGSPSGTAHQLVGSENRAQIIISWSGFCDVPDEKDFYIRIAGPGDTVAPYWLNIWHEDK